MMAAVILVDASKQFMALDEGIDRFHFWLCLQGLPAKPKVSIQVCMEQGTRPVPWMAGIEPFLDDLIYREVPASVPIFGMVREIYDLLLACP